MSQTNFLIGRGELLTHDIKGPGGGGRKVEVYSLSEARSNLRPQFESTATDLDSLPDSACPNDFGVAKLTLNPGYIAKSYFPIALLRASGLESVGSRGAVVKPKKWTKKGTPSASATTELFVAGKRNVFRSLSRWIEDLVPDTDEALDLAHIESFSTFPPDERLRAVAEKDMRFFEVGMHLLPDEGAAFIEDAFKKYAKSLKVKVYTDLSFRAGNLWFVPVEGDRDVMSAVSKFSFVRVIRPMPKLRGFRPLMRTSGISVGCQLPAEQPLSSEPRVALLDGGLPKKHPLSS